MSNDLNHEDRLSPDIQGTPNGAGGSDGHAEPPSADFLASVHTVEVDQGDHREKRSLNFYQMDSSNPVRPEDDLEMSARVGIPREELERLGADPDEVFAAEILPSANVDAPVGSVGMFEKTGRGRVRFLGTMEELGGERVPLDD